MIFGELVHNKQFLISRVLKLYSQCANLWYFEFYDISTIEWYKSARVWYYGVFDICYYVWNFWGVLNFKCTCWGILTSQWVCGPGLSHFWKWNIGFSSPALVRSVAFSVSPRRIVEEELIFVIFGSIFWQVLYVREIIYPTNFVVLCTLGWIFESYICAFGCIVKGERHWCKSEGGN